jgi:hypothetical protein
MASKSEERIGKSVACVWRTTWGEALGVLRSLLQ